MILIILNKNYFKLKSCTMIQSHQLFYKLKIIIDKTKQIVEWIWSKLTIYTQIITFKLCWCILRCVQLLFLSTELFQACSGQFRSLLILVPLWLVAGWINKIKTTNMFQVSVSLNTITIYNIFPVSVIFSQCIHLDISAVRICNVKNYSWLCEFGPTHLSTVNHTLLANP